MFDNLTRLGASAAGEDYEIGRSLRFNIDDSPRLDRAISSASNRKTWTLSLWFKISKMGQDGQIMCQGDGGSTRNMLAVTGEQLIFIDTTSSPDMNLTTKGYIRDVAAWYHVVIQYDTTQGTDTNRCKMYLNGEIPNFSTSTYQPQDTDGYMNSTASGMRFGANPYNTSLSKFDGYLAEVHFIDGSIVPHTTFGKTGKGNKWIPIEVDGVTYGTNGFYLNFSDNSNTTAATLGKDSSGNGNNFTPTNFSVTAGDGNDSMLDTPTNNYCTLNPIDMNGHTTTAASCSNGMLQTTTTDGSGHHNFWSTIGLTSGKWYCEAKAIGSFGVGGYIMLRTLDHGPLDHNKDVSSWTGSGTAPQPFKAYNYLTQYGNLYHGNQSSGQNVADYLPDCSINDIFMMAFDLDAGKIWWGRNNTWGNPGSGAGDPANGTNPAFDNINSSPNQSGDTWCVGGADTNTHHYTFNFGQQGFTYTPPSGFNAICEQNLPEPSILKPETYFKPLLYTGNATNNRTITGVGFEPDLVWIKDRDTASNGGRHYVFDKLRQSGGESVLGMVFDANGDDNNMSDNGRFLGIRSDGFEVSGSDVDTNANATKYVSYNFKESASAGFDMVAYTGTGSSRTVSHNLGVAPEMMIIKNRSNDENWIVYHSGIASDAHTDYIILNTNGAAGDDTWLNDTAPTSSQWEYSGGGNSYNDNGDNYIAYLFTSVEGYSKVGTYYGNGNNDGTFVYCGFKPKFVMMKQSDGTGNWWLFDTARNPENLVSIALYVHLNNKEDDYAADADNPKIDCLSNGFKLRGSYASGFNGSDERHIFLAFAERPFKYANAR